MASREGIRESMKPLRVALIVKASPSTRERENRNMGWWSYPVPEFTWEHFSFSKKGFQVETSKFTSDYDLIFHEDGGNWGDYIGGAVPVVYMAIDSTLTDAHYATRLCQATKSDLVLVDHDSLDRFRPAGVPVRRLAYCVNDRIFGPLEKAVDIVFHCGTGARKGMPGGVERTKLRQYLDTVCKQAGYSYRSGAVGLPEYAQSMGQARVVVNWPRTSINRPHRIFDAMACEACVVTGPLPYIEEDHRYAGEHYVEFANNDELPEILSALLIDERWAKIAHSGNELVNERHTWKTRASELRSILNTELGI